VFLVIAGVGLSFGMRRSMGLAIVLVLYPISCWFLVVVVGMGEVGAFAAN
jgi:hypothetical protein